MKEDRRGRLKMYLELNDLAARRKRVLNLACLLILLISQRNTTVPRPVRLIYLSSATKNYWLVAYRSSSRTSGMYISSSRCKRNTYFPLFLRFCRKPSCVHMTNKRNMQDSGLKFIYLMYL